MDTSEMPSFEEGQGEEIDGNEEEPSSMISENGGTESETGANLSSSTSLIAGPVKHIVAIVTRLETENKKLRGELVMARLKIVEQIAKIAGQNVKLLEAENLIEQQKGQLETAVWKELEAKEKLAKLKDLMKPFYNEDYLRMVANITKHLMDEEDQRSTSKQTLQENENPKKVNLRKRSQSAHSEAAIAGDQRLSKIKRHAPPPSLDESSDSIQNLGEYPEKSTDLSLLPNARPPVLKSSEDQEEDQEELHDEDSSNVHGVGLARKKSVEENEPPEVIICSPLISSMVNSSKTEFKRTGLSVNRSGLLRINDMLRGSNEQDDYQNSFASLRKGQHFLLPMHFLASDRDDDGEVMMGNRHRLANHQSPPSVAAPPPKPNEKEKVKENSAKPLVALHKKDTTKVGFHCTCRQREFKSEQDLKAHIQRNCSKSEFQCRYCDKPYTYESCLIKHMRQYHHSKLAKRPKIKCTKCGKGFQSQQNLMLHTKLFHKMPSVAPVAGSRIWKRRAMKRNIPHAHAARLVSAAASDVRARRRIRARDV